MCIRVICDNSTYPQIYQKLSYFSIFDVLYKQQFTHTDVLERKKLMVLEAFPTPPNYNNFHDYVIKHHAKTHSAGSFRPPYKPF